MPAEKMRSEWVHESTSSTHFHSFLSFPGFYFACDIVMSQETLRKSRRHASLFVSISMFLFSAVLLMSSVLLG